MINLEEIKEQIKTYKNTKQDIKKYGEVFTPLSLVNEMLDKLPKEVWSNPNLKWLDPANGIGNFPVIVVSNLMDGLKEWQPDLELRLKHILENMIYVCELLSKNMFIYLQLFNPENKYKLNFHIGSFLDEGFSEVMKEWGVEKFDIVVGNPPYNSERNENHSSKDIYPEFVNKAFELTDRYVIMITKSNWMTKTTKKSFRNKMINDYNVDKIEHYKNNQFKGTDIRGGVSYFVIDNENTKETFELNGVVYDRKVALDFLPYELDTNELKVLDKLNSYDKISLVNYRSQGWYGIKTNDIRLKKENNEKYFECNVSEQKGKIMYFPLSEISDKMKEDLKKYKIFSTSNYGANPYSLGRVFKSDLLQVCSESLVNWVFDNENDRNMFFDYINTKLFRFCVSLVKNKQNISKNTFKLVPHIDFSKLEKVDDENIYKYLNLTEEDINTIEERCERLRLLR